MKKTNKPTNLGQKAENLADLLSKADSDLLDEAYGINDAEKLAAYSKVRTTKSEKSQNRPSLIRRPAFRSALLTTVCLLLSAGILLALPALMRPGDTVLPPRSSSDAAYGETRPDPDDPDDPDVSVHTGDVNPNVDPSGSPIQPWQGQIGPIGEINSIDRVNYYSALWTLFGDSGASASALSARRPDGGITLLSANKGTSEIGKALTQSYTDSEGSAADTQPTLPPDDDPDIYHYEIDPEQVFTFNRVLLFQIELTDENGFLASKLGTGVADVVIAEGFIDPIITFKRGENYYSCLLNGGHYGDGQSELLEFSTHKYIEGFYIVKNFKQENYEIRVGIQDGQVYGVECVVWDKGSHPDGVLPVVSRTYESNESVSYTVDQLNRYFSSGNLPALPSAPEEPVPPIPGDKPHTLPPVSEETAPHTPGSELFPDADHVYFAGANFICLYADGSLEYGSLLDSSFPRKGRYTLTESGLLLCLYDGDGRPIEEAYTPFQPGGGFLWKDRYYQES